MSRGPQIGDLLGAWSLQPVVVGGCLAAAALYLAGTLRTRHWPPLRSACFLAGLATIATALCSGVDSWSERLLSIHIVQHLLIVLAAPALLLCGAPIRLALNALPRRPRRALAGLLRRRGARALSAPALGVCVFATAVLLSHVPSVFDFALRHPRVHQLEHAAYLFAGLTLLAPLIGADPLPHRPGAIARFAALMAAMTAMTVPSAALTFETHVAYRFYLAPARALGRSALQDQHVAGAIMWVAGGVPLAALALALALAAMLAEERRQRRREAIELATVEAQPRTTRGAAA